VDGGPAATASTYYEVEESGGTSPRTIAISISGAILAAAVFVILIYAVTHQTPRGAPAIQQGSDSGRARTTPQTPDIISEAGKAAAGLAAIALCLFAVALVACNLALMVWVVKDARNRGDDNGVLWMIVVASCGLIGLIIYLAARRSGTLVTCENCQNRRLHYTTACPHCGIRAPASAAT
jgi:hypothetical protein